MKYSSTEEVEGLTHFHRGKVQEGSGKRNEKRNKKGKGERGAPGGRGEGEGGKTKERNLVNLILKFIFLSIQMGSSVKLYILCKATFSLLEPCFY